jgi:hypothetical protein
MSNAIIDGRDMDDDSDDDDGKEREVIRLRDRGGLIYAKERLTDWPDAPVILCDSRTSAEVAHLMFRADGYAVVALRIGTATALVDEVDFSIFQGRDVIYLPTAGMTGKVMWEKVKTKLPYARLLPIDKLLEPGQDARHLDVDGNPEEWLAKYLPPKPPRAEKPALSLRYGFDTTAAQPLGTVVDGLLHAGSVSLFYGPPKSGKSFLVTDLALSICAREPSWMGHEIVRPGPVLVIACEGHAGFWKRIVAAQKERGWSREAFPNGFILATGRPTLIQADGHGFAFAPNPSSILDALAEAKQRGLTPVAIFIDTVFRSIGAGNVNASPDMNAYLAAIATLTDQRFAVGLVHHEVKSGGTPAGSVTLIGGSDDIIHVWRQSEESDQRFWQVEMAKDDAETLPRAFTLKRVSIGLDPDGRPASSCVISDAGSAPDAKRKRGRPAGTNEVAVNAELVYQALINLLADPATILQEIRPDPQQYFRSPAVTRTQLRATLNQTGIFVAEGDLARQEKTIGKKIERALNLLKVQGKVIMTNRLVGLPATQPPRDQNSRDNS